MKKGRIAALAAAMFIGLGAAQAQYYQIANQIPQMLSPALTGGFNYKGFVDASYIAGIGDRKADFLEFTTTQGLRYSSWFFMGVGAGVDILFSNTNDNYNPGQWRPSDGFDTSKGHTKTVCMIPLYSDFRFTIGDQKSTSFFIDLRVGASFLVGNNYVEIGDGYLTNSQCFYLKPSVGLRIPLNESGKQALNVGLTYQLLTSDYWYRSSSNVTLNSFGATVGFEW